MFGVKNMQSEVQVHKIQEGENSNTHAMWFIKQKSVLR